MNAKLSIRDARKKFPMFDKKEVNNMISRIDRKRILIFVAIAYGITIVAALVIFFDGGHKSDFTPVTPLAIIFSYLFGYAPALANIATRLITREGWSNTYLRPNLRRGWPFYLAACILPITAIILGGSIYFLLFPGKFDLSMAYARETGEISATDTLATVMSREALGGFFIVLFGALLLFIGEEFGWRAYLLPKLMPLGPRKAVLLTGAVFGMFHWPVIFMGFQYGLDYWGAPVVGPLLFVLIIMSPSVIFSWVTLRTGSVWPACIAHAAHNAFCSLMITFLRGAPDVLIGPVPEGIVGCLGYVLLALPIFLIPRALAPVVMTLSQNPAAVEKAADQMNLGTA
ncbi:MAG: CPBP family intramembrane metalloprotease [Anaerolineales bacterium]|nr:CPBP family intramembrane metalloprotease [Anaerolineales bacterium]